MRALVLRLDALQTMRTQEANRLEVARAAVSEGIANHLDWLDQEIERLINVKELSPSALAELSAEALKLDKHAAQTVPSVFAASNPAVRAH